MPSTGTRKSVRVTPANLNALREFGDGLGLSTADALRYAMAAVLSGDVHVAPRERPTERFTFHDPDGILERFSELARAEGFTATDYLDAAVREVHSVTHRSR